MAFIIIIKKNIEIQYLSTFAFNNYGQLADYNFEKLYPRFLALASDFFFFFFESLASNAVTAVCPRLHLWLVV